MASAKKWHFSIDKETLEVVESTVISDDDLFLECKYCLKMIVVLQVWFWHPFSQSPCLVMQHSCFVVLVSWHCMHRLRKIQFVTLTACFSVQSIHGGAQWCTQLHPLSQEGIRFWRAYQIQGCQLSLCQETIAPCTVQHTLSRCIFVQECCGLNPSYPVTVWHRINRTWCKFYMHFTSALRELRISSDCVGGEQFHVTSVKETSLVQTCF